MADLSFEQAYGGVLYFDGYGGRTLVSMDQGTFNGNYGSSKVVCAEL